MTRPLRVVSIAAVIAFAAGCGQANSPDSELTRLGVTREHNHTRVWFEFNY